MAIVTVCIWFSNNNCLPHVEQSQLRSQVRELSEQLGEEKRKAKEALTRLQDSANVWERSLAEGLAEGREAANAELKSLRQELAVSMGKTYLRCFG